MSDRFVKVGIQRELHLEWFEQAARIQGSGISKRDARQEIYSYLDNAPGFATSPSLQSKTYIANALIKSWIDPAPELASLRNAAFNLLQEHNVNRTSVHWCLLGAAYPFWFEVAAKIGRLLNLQDQVTQAQVVLRLKENYGDRQTISRRARYVIRSYVSWGVLKDSEIKGSYGKLTPVPITNYGLATFMLEAALNAMPEGKAALGLLLNNPAFFPFNLPVLSGDFIAQQTDRIDVVRYGLDDEMLKLKVK